MECNDQVFTPTNNQPIPCDGDFKSTECVLTPNAISFLNLPVNSSQQQINTAFVQTIQGLLQRIQDLENQ